MLLTNDILRASVEKVGALEPTGSVIRQLQGIVNEKNIINELA
jgi:hypothetical protein